MLSRYVSKYAIKMIGAKDLQFSFLDVAAKQRVGGSKGRIVGVQILLGTVV
jgi:hypothetical protein